MLFLLSVLPFVSVPVTRIRRSLTCSASTTGALGPITALLHGQIAALACAGAH